MVSDNLSSDTQPSGSSRRSNVAIILLLLLLLFSIGYNIYQYMDHKQEVKSRDEEIISGESLRASLKDQLDSIRAELEVFRGRNADLDKRISENQEELQNKAAQIEKLLRDNKISYNRYLAAKKEIDKFKFYAEQNLAEIKRLSEENKRLTAENQDLQQNVKTQKREIDKLTDDNVLKTNKLSLASRLIVDPKDISVSGIRLRSGNRETETDRAKRIEKLKVCFAIPSNLAASAGKKQIFLQIINPKGETVSIESLGSGTTTVEGESAQYSTAQEIEYDNEKVNNHCIYWGNPNDVKFEPGNYRLVLFTEGYKMGEKMYIVK